MFKANKIKIYPNRKQRRILASNHGCVRWMYNWALNYLNNLYEESKGSSVKNKKRMPSKYDMINMITELKKQEETLWLKEADRQSLNKAIEHLYQAFKLFFDKTNKSKYPNFKSKNGKQSATYTQSVKVIDENHVQIPKLGIVYARGIRNFAGKIKFATVTKSCAGNYYISIMYDNGIESPEVPKIINKDKFIGIDFGLEYLAITSDGIKHENPRPLKNALSKMRQLSKTLSRRTKGSARYEKARINLAKAHEKVSNIRSDHQHKLSNKLVRENQGISLETLDIKNMSKRLSRSIKDAAWGELAGMLEYKSTWAGKPFIKVGKYFASSKICSGCGEEIDKMPLSIREWTCQNCHQTHDRDINAAKNIKREGIRLLNKSNRVDSLIVEAVLAG